MLPVVIGAFLGQGGAGKCDLNCHRASRGTDRTALAGRLQRAGIAAAVHYPIPVHRTAAYRADTLLEHTELACVQVLSLPVHPGLTAPDLARIVKEVNR